MMKDVLAARERVLGRDHPQTVRTRLNLATAFAQYQQNRWWGELAASVGYLDYKDLERQFDLGQTTRSEKGDTDGDLWSLSGRIGYDIAQSASSPWHLSPFVSADYARVEVDGDAEDSVRSTALEYGDQKRNSSISSGSGWKAPPLTAV